MNKKFNRNNAFSINIADNSSDMSGSIQYIIPLKDSLFSFTDNFITEVMTAKSIDPENLYPETRHSWQKIYDIGCNNSYVARTIIQTKQILDSTILNQSTDKKVLLDHTWDCSELLFKCEEAYNKIFAEVMELMHECDAIVEKNKKNSAIPTLPQVDDLEVKVGTFLGYAKRFLEKTHEYLCLFYNAPNLGSNFHSYREWMSSHKPDKETILKILKEDKDWLKQIADLRNAHDMNHSRSQFNVEIENFKIQPGNKFTCPIWKYDLSDRSGPVQTEFSDIIKDMSVYLPDLLTFFEVVLISCIQDNINKNFPIEIFRHKPENINKKCPTIYFISKKKDI